MQEPIISEAWKQAYPGAAVGTLTMTEVQNPTHHAELDARKRALEQALRSRLADHDRAMLRALPILQAYDAYYKRFRKTYHVQLQLESVVLKGKPIPRVAALVEAMFMAELDNLLLTAGHDLEAVRMPIRVDVARGDERYVRINGQEETLKAGDMMITDAQGVLSSVIYGPDRRTQITPQTEQVLFTVYAPPGVARDAVKKHLEDVRENVLLVAPGAQVLQLRVYG
jgi:DNA/RNA-binding domain of Phe-tRNA-synthetase-like protein